MYVFHFLECEKSNAEERSLGENQSEVQSNPIFDKIGAKSPSFPFIKQRISTDSNVSEKELSADDSKSTAELKSVEDLKSVDELKDETKSTNEHVSIDLSKSTDEPEDSAQKKKTDSSNASEKESVKLSESDQSRKLELALQRIKGYVSLNVDSEKDEIQNEDNKIKDKNEESEEKISEVTEKAKTEKSKVLSPLFKEFITLPVAQPSESQETVDDVSIVLETTKKTDSFYLKLNETIESCKAKLGISEINDDLSSDESAIDDNASRSDEDEEDETSASEAEEEVSEEDADEEESMEVSDEENENKVDGAESDEVENENKIDDAESDEEESESQDSELSDTDIESSNETSPKKLQKSNFSNTDDKNDEKEVTPKDMKASEDCVKNLINDSSEAIITNPDMQVPEVTIDESGAMEVVGENSISESSNDVKGNSESSLSRQANEIKVSKVLASSQESMDDSVYDVQSNSFSEASKEESCNIECVQINDSHSSCDLSLSKNNSPFKNIVNNSSPIKKITSPRRNTDKKSEDIKPNLESKEDGLIVNKGTSSPPQSKNEAEEEDDDDEVLICTPTRPKSPPVIVLDDDQENENSSASDTFAIKSPPYSTSIDSLSNEENPNCRTNSGDDPNNNHGKTIPINDDISHEEVIGNNEEKNANTNVILVSRNSEERRKRKFSSESSSDDEDIQVVTPKKPTLTGAIRTFHKPNNSAPSLKPITPTVESVKRNLERESLSQLDKSPVLLEDGAKEGKYLIFLVDSY